MNRRSKLYISLYQQFLSSSLTQSILFSAHFFSEEEVKQAAFDQPHDKVPGPDGHPSEFYKIFWNEIKIDFLSAVLHFSTHSRIPSEWSTDPVIFISKKDHVQSPSNLRPINLCNTHYKILCKLLANKLSNILEEQQSWFLSDGDIIDNIMIAQEMYHSIHVEQKNKLLSWIWRRLLTESVRIS